MLVDFDGLKARVDVDEEGSFISKHTGAALQALKVLITIRGKVTNDEFLTAIERSKRVGVVSLSEEGTPQQRWKIGSSSWSFRDGSERYQHSLELSEVEELKIDALELGTVTLRPYEYEEIFDKDELNIEAKSKVTEAEHLQLKAMQKTRSAFAVIRHGINESSRTMRLGLCYWSQDINEYKYQLVLHDDSVQDKANHLSLAFRWMRNLRDVVAEDKAVMEALIVKLQEKGLLTEGEVVNLRQDISERTWDNWYSLFRVGDVDDI